MDKKLEVTKELPTWRPNQKNATPGPVPLWSGKAIPPAIGARVRVRINNCGPGVVTAYAVYEGYLGLMVQLDDSTRPEWHRKQNPDNPTALVFGAEIDIL